MKNREFIQRISASFTGTEDDETRIWKTEDNETGIWNQEDFVNASISHRRETW